ncbi:hypothetical protein [Lysobacter gummosus]|uniref:hypothetical protein n=1 Tax=Lysobacter gummosus TaxID=262324 RepID=UPI00362E8EC7
MQGCGTNIRGASAPRHGRKSGYAAPRCADRTARARRGYAERAAPARMLIATASAVLIPSTAADRMPPA